MLVHIVLISVLWMESKRWWYPGVSQVRGGWGEVWPPVEEDARGPGEILLVANHPHLNNVHLEYHKTNNAQLLKEGFKICWKHSSCKKVCFERCLNYFYCFYVCFKLANFSEEASNLFLCFSQNKHLVTYSRDRWAVNMAAAQIAKKLKDKRQKSYIEGIFKKVIFII